MIPRPKTRTIEVLFVGAVLTVVSGLAMSATGPLGPPDVDPAPAAAAPQKTPKIAFAPLAEGSRMVYRTVNPDGRASVEDWTVMPETTFKGRAVTPLRSGSTVQILDSRNRNLIATLRGKDSVEEVEPDRGVFVWPLELGNSWQAEFTYHDRANNFSVGPIGTTWTVEAWESVTTPAGTFPAMRLRGEPARNNTRRTVIWYAPEPGMVVRRQVVQATGRGSERATTTSELVDYAPR